MAAAAMAAAAYGGCSWRNQRKHRKLAAKREKLKWWRHENGESRRGNGGSISVAPSVCSIIGNGIWKIGGIIGEIAASNRQRSMAEIGASAAWHQGKHHRSIGGSSAWRWQ